MSAVNGWVRAIDAIDLMRKSGWSDFAAKEIIAAHISEGVMPWAAEWSRYRNPETDETEPLSDKINAKLRESTVRRCFRTIAGNPDGDEDRHTQEGLNVFVADWRVGIFRLMEWESLSGPFFGVYGLLVGKNELSRLLTAETILNCGDILDFDFTIFGPTWAQSYPSLPDFDRRIEAPSGQRKSRIAAPELRRWWQSLGQSREPIGIRALWLLAQEAYPEKIVPRRAIEELAAGRKRGRKPIDP